MLPAGDSLALLRDFWRADPIFPTFFPMGVETEENMLVRDDILARPFFFFVSGSFSRSREHTEPESVTSFSTSTTCCTEAPGKIFRFLFLKVKRVLEEG